LGGARRKGGFLGLKRFGGLQKGAVKICKRGGRGGLKKALSKRTSWRALKKMGGFPT